MPFHDLPRSAAWRHRDARNGFEVVFLSSDGEGYCLEGGTVAVESGEAWFVQYAIALNGSWLTQHGRVRGRASSGVRELVLESDAVGHWKINNQPAAHLDGCLDVDLESSALTNAFPVHRLGLEVGQHGQAPAAYVRALDLRVERLEQRYVRLNDDADRERYHYTAPQFEFECQLVYDQFGLVLDYPGIAVRTA
jgi:hypothetical protein